MKNRFGSFGSLATAVLWMAIGSAQAQPGGGPAPSLDGAMAKLFGNNSSFSATMELHSSMGPGGEMVMPGKMSFAEGKSRFEMDMANMQGGNIPPQAAAQMKQMGMSRMTTIGVPDKKLAFVVYPDMKAYVEVPTPNTGAAAAADYKSAVTKLGTESVEGHDCVKNKVVVTGPDGAAHESTVWNAKDLKDFPVKIQTASAQGSMTMLFRDVKLQAPGPGSFEVPAGFTKYSDMTSLMMNRMRGGAPSP